MSPSSFPPFIIPLTYVLAALWLHHRRYTRGSRRATLLLTAVLTALWAVAGCELLSPFRAIRFWPLFLWWLLPALFWLTLLLRAARRHTAPPILRPWLRNLWPGPGAAAILLLTAAALTASLISAAKAPPTNADALSYHLVRQVRWMQNHSVAHYPVTVFRQLEMPPFAEFAGLHLMVLSDWHDHWVNTVQWAAAVLTAAAASLLARELGARRPIGQALAAALVILSPPVYLQSNNPKNDVVLALWVVSLMLLAARCWNRRSCNPVDAALAGALLGLGLLTKGTMFVIAAPVGACFAATTLRAALARTPDRRRALLSTASRLAVLGLAAALVPLGHWTRNYRVFGSPLGLVIQEKEYHNQLHTPAGIASNLVRNTALHLTTADPDLNARMIDRVRAVHARLGLDPADPRTTFNAMPFDPIYAPYEEDYAGATVMIALAALVPPLALAATAASVALARLRRRNTPRAPRRFGPAFWAALATPYAAYALFCTSFKWQPWHTRLHIPILCLLAAPAAVTLTAGALRFLLPYLATAAAAVALWPALTVNARALVGERSVFNVPTLQQRLDVLPGQGHLQSVLRTVNYVHRLRVRQVALWRCQWEYLLLWLIDHDAPVKPRFVSVTPWANVRVPEADVAEVVVQSVTPAGPTPATFRCTHSDVVYSLVARFGEFAIYVRPDRLSRARSEPDKPPAVAGFSATEGLEGLLGGPFESPVVRASADTIRLTFKAPGHAAALRLALTAAHAPDRNLRILLNGAEVARRTIPAGTDSPARVGLALNAKRGENELVLDFGPGGASAVSFTTLSVGDPYGHDWRLAPRLPAARLALAQFDPAATQPTSRPTTTATALSPSPPRP